MAIAAPQIAPARERSYEELEEIFAGVDAPFAFVDLDALWANGREMLARAAGTPIRVASKSVRCRPLLASILEQPGFQGLMTFTLPESLWLHAHGFDDLLLAYPTAHRAALAELAQLESERPPIVMIDSVEHLDYIEAAVGEGRAGAGRPIRVCLDLDTGWWPLGGRLKVGAKRSPVRTPEQARALAREVVARPRFELAAVMGYEAHIAGLGDRPGRGPLGAGPQRGALGKRLQGALIGAMQRRSAAEIAERRAAVVAAVREVAPVEIVNGGGTGSIHTTGREDVITEITAGSGFFAPTLFDRYSGFTLTPAAMFAMPVVRRPSGGVATLLGGGYLASGAAGPDRLPAPYLPRGLRLDRMEGAGEVQTPVIGSAAASLRIGDRVYLRHAKAGELCERFDGLHLVRGREIVDLVPTYRGEGRAEL
jgi:D-serine deaminase-like pyridoxal phosphate-dependent protein